jgi:hypothetical protein
LLGTLPRSRRAPDMPRLPTTIMVASTLSQPPGGRQRGLSGSCGARPAARRSGLMPPPRRSWRGRPHSSAAPRTSPPPPAPPNDLHRTSGLEGGDNVDVRIERLGQANRFGHGLPRCVRAVGTDYDRVAHRGRAL